MDLQTTFYVVGIVFMGLMLILLVALVTAVFVIRAKINAIHQHIEEKFSAVSNIIESGAKIVGKVKRATGK